MKKLTLMLVLAMVCCIAAGASAHFSGTKICIDPGHGGSDPGAVGNGLEEKDINLDIGLRARDLFQHDGATVIMTRSTDVYVSLSGRCSIANNNGANRFISTHCNAFSATSANGTETFCYSGGSSNSFDLRNKVNPEMVAHMGTYNRGVKTASFYVLVHTSMPAILGEVAFISNPTDASKLGNPSYRQEAARAYLHGTQQHYSQTPHDPVSGPPAQFVGFSVGANQDGRLEVFARGSDNGVYHNYQWPGGAGGWSGWWSMNAAVSDHPHVGRNTNGCLQLFARGLDEQVWTCNQLVPNGGWSGWYAMGGLNGWVAESPSVGQNQDGRLELFARGAWGLVCQNWQWTPGGGWSGWWDMGFYASHCPNTGMNSNGCLELFARGTDEQVWHTWQEVPNGGWSAWYAMGGLTAYGYENWVAETPSVGQNQDGHLELFARGGWGLVCHNWQMPSGPGGWSGWWDMGFHAANVPSVGRNADGRLEIFVRGTDSQVWHCWQVTPNGGWSGWYSLGGSVADSPQVGCNSDGRLELFVLGGNGVIYRAWQLVPNGGWSAWFPL